MNNCNCPLRDLDDGCTSACVNEAFYKKGRVDAIDEVIKIARAEIDFENQAEQKRFVEFMEQLKEQKK